MLEPMLSKVEIPAQVGNISAASGGIYRLPGGGQGPNECWKEDSVSQVYLVVVIQLLSPV